MDTRRTPAEIDGLVSGLAPYARRSFEGAAELALRLHAEELSPEHWLAALLKDEDCAATRVVLHAFADPETLGIEVLALCAGIMVVGSRRTMPFSVLGVEALRAARGRGAARGAAQVSPSDVFLAALGYLEPELRARIAHSPGFSETSLEEHAAPGGDALPLEGPLFRCFAADSLRALGAAARAAASLVRDAVGPAHLVLGTLESDASLRERSSLTPARVRMLSTGLDADGTPLPPRLLGIDASLRALLEELPAGAGTEDVLGWILARGGEEVTALLRRQRITAPLLERCRGAYQDPETPS